jgi:hypothetical protein
MKRLILAAIVLALIPMMGDAQVRVDQATLFYAFDLDGEAADADQVVTLANGVLTDSTQYNLTADPDVCRLLDITVVDTNLSVGTLTVTGKGCLSEARECSFAFTAGDDTGVQTLTCTDGEGAYFSDVVQAETGLMTGESDETFTLGYTSNSVNGWAITGTLKPIGPNGEQGVDPFAAYGVQKKITTSAVSSTTVTGVVGAEDAFEVVSVGDILIITVSGYVYERPVTAKASADSITIAEAITIPAAGVTYKYKKLYYSTNPADDLSFGVRSYKTLLVNWSVDANVNTGGVVTNFQCTYDSATNPGALWTQLDTTTVASAGTQDPTTESVNLQLLPYSRCRFGLSFGTGDDGDGANEDINAAIVLMQ